MPKYMAIVGRFPAHELAIRRLCGLDTRFLSICEDYEEAVTVLRRWEQGGAEHIVRVNEYRGMVAELEVDILNEIEAHMLRVSQQKRH